MIWFQVSDRLSPQRSGIRIFLRSRFVAKVPTSATADRSLRAFRPARPDVADEKRHCSRA